MKHASFTLLLLCLAATRLMAQSGENVLLVVNGASADSERIATHYARTRGVPQTQVLRLTTDATADEIPRDAYDAQIQVPIADWLRRNSAQDRILYIVLTKGIPLRVRGTSGRTGTVASVDSELTLLYRRLTGLNPTLPGPLANPYFLGDMSVTKAKRFSHEWFDIYLVTRLDGYTVDDVLKLIDRGATPVHDGKIFLNEREAIDEAPGNAWLKAAADWMAANGAASRVVLETTDRTVAGEKDILGYYSFGSNDPAITTRTFQFEFVAGAIAGMFVSTDARTFSEPPAGWTIGPWTDRTKFFAGSPQSLTGDLVRAGVTGAAGYVTEPYLDGSVRPNVLFPAYFTGFDLAESFYLAMPYVSWQTVVVGDPLCTPFSRHALEPPDIDKGIDPATETPAWISARRVQVAIAGGTKPEAARMLVKAEARTAKGDQVGAAKALEEATAIDPTMVAAHLLLAQFYESNQEYDKAIDRYRTIIAAKPNEPIALNNLAYALAVRKGQPAEAVGYAERAHTLARGNPTIADTLGWIEHLLGHDREAAQLLAGVVTAMPNNADVRLHAAVVFEAIGMFESAASELAAALRLDASLAGSDEVKALKRKLEKK